MSKKNWFTPTVVVPRGQLMASLSRKRDRNAPLPRTRGARIIDMGAWKYPRVGRKIKFMDRIEVVYTTRDLMKILDIDKSTVYQWSKMGMIPPPLFTRTNHYQKETKYFIRPQIAVIARVVNDLRRQGVMRFRAEKIQHHLKMIKEGNAIAIEGWHRKRERQIERDEWGRSKVIWLPDGDEYED